jgi:4-hydroxyphenylpyruvate dioxygenase
MSIVRSIATVSLSGSLRDKLYAIAHAGYEGVEIFESDLLAFDGDAKDVRHLAEDLNLKIVTLQPFRDFEGLPEPQRSRAFARAEQKFELMQQLGTDLLLVCSNCSLHSQGGIGRAADDLRELGERAAQRSLRIGYEALAWGRYINDYRDAWEIVRRVDHPSVGIVLDSFHTLARKHDLTTLASIPGEKIYLVQLADAPVLEMGMLSWSRHYRCFPGQGWLPIPDFMAALATTGYNGPLSLEIFNDQFRAAAPKQIAVDGLRSLRFLAEQTQPEPATSQTLCEGIEFLEFAISPTLAPDLERILRQLGFAPRGQHRSKKVNAWSQGDINLVVNFEVEGFAQVYQQTHGTSVCAIGLRTQDAAAASERAQQYLCRPHAQAIGMGELAIPAVQTINDNLVYLIDHYGTHGSIWDVDFVPSKLDAFWNADAGLTSIDHIGQVVPVDQLSSWVILYRAVFGFEAAPQFDIPDPSGLMQSQVIESADKRVRITLNASQYQSTLAGRFLTQYSGSGIQHIAFATDDIFSTLHRLRTNGVQILPIPSLYYDDLAARFGLSTEQTTQLKTHDVLYDQNEAGEFYHAYTQTLDNRLFFEIVQRVSGYNDYGQVNSPIRIAAQARMAQAYADLQAQLER